MSKTNDLDISRTVLTVIDVQESFRNAIPDFALVVSRIAMAVRAFRVLEVPIIVTEQYPKGLGRTAEEVLFSLPDGVDAIEKSTFSAFGEPSFVNRLKELGAGQVLLCGIEAHVCVNQTARDLIDKGYDVHLLTDCVASRFEHDRVAGIERMKAASVIISSAEMGLFELIRDSKHEKVREVQAQIK